jgi:phosphatidate cytidylyltransferase
MNPQEKFYWLMAGIVGLLLFATVIGWVIGLRAKSESSQAVVQNLNARIRAWWVMIGVFAVAFLVGTGTTLVLFAFTSFFALREFITLTPTKRGDHIPLFLSFFVLFPDQYLLIWDRW